jgi:hypothetical protein
MRLILADCCARAVRARANATPLTRAMNSRHDEGCLGRQGCRDDMWPPSSQLVPSRVLSQPGLRAGHRIANPLPRMVVPTKIGTAVVPDGLPRRPPPDGQMHACIRNTAQGPYVMCIFMPAGL